VPFPANPLADANGNGQPDLIDYALGNDLGRPLIFPALALQPDTLGGPETLLLTYPLSLGAERAKIEVLFSTDLVAWAEGAPYLEAESMQPLSDGRALVTWRVKPPLGDEPRVFMQLRVTGE
jgi:hypothetical protein